MTTLATYEKRQQLRNYIRRELLDNLCVQAVVAVGSVASGTARPDSDIDAIVFLEPLDLYAVPSEATWRPEDNTYHNPFAGIEGVDVDFRRLDLGQWRDAAFEWPEPRRAELYDGWIAFDRHGEVEALIIARTTFDDVLRMARLDDAVVWLDQHLGENGPQVRWKTLGPAIAHDRLQAAYNYLVQGLFAYNRRWRPWRNREMTALLKLPWLPKNFEERVVTAINPPSHDYAGYRARVATLRTLFSELVQQLQAENFYGDDPISEAFIRSHEEPGRSWNIPEWELEHRRRYPAPE